MKRVLVCGGRDYGRIDPRKILEHPKRRAEMRRVRDTLESLAEFGPFVLIHGGAKGADTVAGTWASARDGFPTPLVFAADWDDLTKPDAVVKRTKKGKLYDALAGHRRNQKMIDEGRPDLVVAFPGGTGTADMVSRARVAGINIMEIK